MCIRDSTNDIIVRSPSGIVIGNQAVISTTIATLAEFPDRKLLGEDIIWSGTPETGMLSSHRILSTATHNGNGIYGTATGKKLHYRIIADCHAFNDQINDEWLIRDQGAIVKQIGWDPKQFVADLIKREGGPDLCSKPFTEQSNKIGPYDGKGNDNKWGLMYVEILNDLMTGRMSVINEKYDRAVQSEMPGGITGYGREPIDKFWMNLRSAFPNAKFKIHHQIGREDNQMPPRAAIRWSLSGKHDGWGAFERPTGANIYMMGISHAEFGPWGIRREYTVIDETAIWKQIILKTG